MRLAQSQAHQPFPGFFKPGFLLSNHRCKSLFQGVCPDSNRAFSCFMQMRSASALFQFLKGRWLQRLKRQAGENLSGLIFYNRRIVHMGTQNTSRQLRYLEEIRISLHRAGFGTLPLEGAQLPVLWNGAPLCRITGKGSVFYRREDADTPQAEDALYRVEDIAAKTLEYMTAMETAPRLKATDLTGDYRILADFGDAVLAGHPTERGVQFVTWEWDFDREGVHHGHYFQDDYEAAKRDFTVRSGLVQKDALFEQEQLAQIYHALSFVREQDETLSFGRDQELAELMEQVGGLLPADALRQRDAPEQSGMTMK